MQLLQTTCRKCFLEACCLPSKPAPVIRNKVLKRQLTLKRHAFLWQYEDIFRSLYIIRAGSLKGYKLDDDGQEHILQFYFAGDIVGFEALQMKRYPYSVSALAETIVCEISFEALLEATRDYPFLQQQLFILMSQRINRGALALGLQAERKLAYFLLEMFNRLSASSPYPTVVLPMSRQDIANHLGLAAETITRLLNNFVQADVIKTHKREICFNNIDKLKSISAGAIKEDKTKLS